MNRVLLRVAVVAVAMLILSSGLIVNDSVAVHAQPAMADNAKTVADSTGMGLAVVSILLGGCMVYIFRPKHRPATESV